MSDSSTTALPPRSIWSGWGDPRERKPLARHVPAFLRDRLGVEPPPRRPLTPPVPLSQVRLRPPALPEQVRAALAAIVGPEHVRADVETRVSHAGGKSYPDLVRRRAGDAEQAPDAVVLPGTPEQVQRVLEECVRARVAVVPFGGGTSVVGGVEPVRGRFAAVVSLDLARLDRLVDVDPLSLTATLRPGMRGPQVEAALAPHGLTLGHLPQSHQQATLGGYLATRSAGQASTGYGRPDEHVLALRVATPAGELRLGGGAPASAAGPRLIDLFVGSEGTLGVITEATLAVRPRPRRHAYSAWAFPDFHLGTEALRVLAQRLGPQAGAPEVCRLSDEEETAFTLAMTGGVAGAAQRRYLRARGLERPALAIFMWDGDRGLRARVRAAAGVLADHGGVRLGQAPALAWAKGRFGAPYLRDELLDRGVLVETLETAASWSRLPKVYQAVSAALDTALTDGPIHPVVGCHVSHLYRGGASLYFTFLARAADDPLAQWRAAKTAASEAIVAAGATITHHHAVGIDHRPWMIDEIGPLGVEVLRAVKHRLDPTGILNPGKLIPDADPPAGGLVPPTAPAPATR